MMYKSAIRVIDINIGLISNQEELVHCNEFLDAETQKKNPTIWSILTALPAPTRIPYEEKNLDAFFYMIDDPNVPPDVVCRGNTCTITGDFSAWEHVMADKRWNIYGNIGLFFAFCLVMLEEKARIHSMHASALYNAEKDLLLVVAGSSGSGKTVLQLEALLSRGYEVFTTEMTHFRVEENGCTFFKGSVYDNIRVGNLIYDFPKAIDHFHVQVPEVEDKWETYLPVNFEPWSTKAQTLHNPRTIFLFPRIETGRKETVLHANPGRAGFIKSMFENASEKICKSQVMYNGYPCFGSFDRQNLAKQRLDDIVRLLDMEFVTDRIKLLAAPQDCWAWEKAIQQ